MCVNESQCLFRVAYPFLGEVVDSGSAQCRALSDACALAVVFSVCLFCRFAVWVCVLVAQGL